MVNTSTPHEESAGKGPAQEIRPNQYNLDNCLKNAANDLRGNRYLKFNVWLLEDAVAKFPYLREKAADRLEQLYELWRMNEDIDEQELGSYYLRDYLDKPNARNSAHWLPSGLAEHLYGDASLSGHKRNELLQKVLFMNGPKITEAWFNVYGISEDQTKLRNYVNAITDIKGNTDSLSFSTLWSPHRIVSKSIKHLGDNYLDEESDNAAIQNMEIAKDAVEDVVKFASSLPGGRANTAKIVAVALAGSLAGCQNNPNYGYSPKDDIDFLLITDDGIAPLESPLPAGLERHALVSILSSYINSELGKKYGVEFCTLGDIGGESPMELSQYMTPSNIKQELESGKPGWAELAYTHLRFGGTPLYEREKGWLFRFKRTVIFPYDKIAKIKMNETRNFILK